MARIRSIHPDALKSEKLAASSAEAERCYWRLSTHCDDAGICEDDPQILAAFLFPRSDEITGAVMDGWLTELHTVGLVVRYEAEGHRYLVVTRWADYQKPNRPTPSKYPNPPDNPPPTHAPLSEPSVNAHAPLTLGEGEGEGDIRAAATQTAHAFEREFDDWWKGWPKKLDKAKAAAEYRARRRQGIGAGNLLAARDNYVRSKQGDLEHMKYPATFLHGPQGPWSEWVAGVPLAAQASGNGSQGPQTPTREVNGHTQRFYPGTGWI